VINTVPTRDRTTVQQYLAAMQAGPAGLEELVGLFEDDAVYVEPFSGKTEIHSGKAEIRAFFENALENHLKGVRLTSWSRNLRASGEAWLKLSGQERHYRASEVPPAERGPIIAAYLDKYPQGTRQAFEKLPDPVDHPTFRLVMT
jgi:uncharacterized protein (TIGR02246 family)